MQTEDETISRRHSRRALLRSAFSGISLGAGYGLLPPAARAAENSEPIRQLDNPSPQALVARAFDMRNRATDAGDQPYGALVADAEGRIIGEAPSRVVTATDPTAHAEMEAIRDAARRAGSRRLSGLVLYSSSRPCPMCEAAAYWAGIARMIHGRDARDSGAPRLCG